MYVGVQYGFSDNKWILPSKLGSGCRIIADETVFNEIVGSLSIIRRTSKNDSTLRVVLVHFHLLQLSSI